MTIKDQTHGKVSLKCHSSDTKPTNDVKAGSEFYETDTGNLYVFYGTTWYQKSASTAGNTNVRPILGTAETTKNRNIAVAATTYAAATNDATWTETDNVTEILITSFGAGTTEFLDDMALIVYDGLNEAAVTAFFADDGGIASDVEYELINLARPFRETFTSYLTKVSIVPLGGAATRFVITAQ